MQKGGNSSLLLSRALGSVNFCLGIVLLRSADQCSIKNSFLFFRLQVIEVTSPTAGSVLVDLSQLQMFQVCHEVSVRTMSQYGESVDSVPAQISSVLLRSSHCTSPVCTTVPFRLPRGSTRASLPARSPQHTSALLIQQKIPAESSDAKLADPSSIPVGSARPLTEKASSPLQLPSPSASLAPGSSPQGSDTVGDKKCLSVPPQQAGTVLPGQGMEPGPLQELGLQQPGEGTEVQVSACISCPVPGVQRRAIDPFWGVGQEAAEHLSVTQCCLLVII